MSDARRSREGELRLAYVVPQYPTISHRFILQEVARLRDLGVHVSTFSVRRTGPDQHLTEEDRREFASTYAILPASLGTLVRAHLACWLRRPRGYMEALAVTLKMRRPGLRGLLWQFFYLAEAVVLWHRCEALASRHLHGQFASNASEIVLLAARLGGRGWSASFSLHGSAEFYDVSQFRLADKVRQADLVTCASEFARAQACSLVEEEHWSKMHVVHLGIDGEKLSPPGDLRGAGPLRLVTVGRLVPIKGQALLVEAVARLRERGIAVEATIVGGGPRRESLERLVEELGVADVVTLTGALGHDDVLERYAAADVFCLPSFGEGIPVVLMEAMAMQLPVVASRVMGIPELVDHGRSGLLVTPGRTDLLVDAIVTLAADEQLRAKMGRAGREKVLSDFNLDDSARKLRTLFSELIL